MPSRPITKRQEPSNQKLPDEILVEIFIYLAKFDRFDQNVKIRDKNFLKVLTLNKKFLGLLVGKVDIPSKFYALIPLSSTKYIKSFDSSEHYLQNLFSIVNLSYLSHLRATEGDNSPIIDDFGRKGVMVKMLMLETDEFERYIKEIQLEGVDEEQKRYICREQKAIKKVQGFYERALCTDYQVLNFDFQKKMKDMEQYSKNYDTHVFSSVESVLSFCERIMNNENSIMKKYVKVFDVDLLFLDEIQTSRTSKNTLFGSKLEKYTKIDKTNYFSIRPKPFKLGGNFLTPYIDDVLSKHLEVLNASDNVPACSNPLKLKYDTIDFFQTVRSFEEFVCEAQEQNHEILEQLLLSSLFIKYFLDGTRSSIVKNSRKEIKNSFEEMIENFGLYQMNHVQRKINFDRLFGVDVIMIPDPWPIHDSDIQQFNCINLCAKIVNEVAGKLQEELSVTQEREGEVEETYMKGYIQVAKELLTKNEVERLVDVLMKAMTINSSDHIDTSLITFSPKTNSIMRRDDFEIMKTKMIVVKKPALKF